MEVLKEEGDEASFERGEGRAYGDLFSFSHHSLSLSSLTHTDTLLSLSCLTSV